MTNKLKKNLYILSILLIIILSVYMVKLFYLYSFCCIILNIILPVFLGFIFAWILNPLFIKLNTKLSKKLSLFILIMTFLLFYTLILWKFFPLVTENISNLSSTFKELIDKLSHYPFLDKLNKLNDIDIGVLIDSCSNVFEIICVFALTHVFGFYILYTFEEIKAFIPKLIPKKYRSTYLEYIRLVSKNMHQFLKGTLLDTLILFVASSIVYFFIGLKYPIILALFSAITNIIPFVGPYIGGIPAVLIGLGKNLNTGIITLISIVIIQAIESNIINPVIMSKTIKINPILILITLSIMGKFFGLLGMIFAVPTLIMIKLSIPFFQNHKSIFLKRKTN